MTSGKRLKLASRLEEDTTNGLVCPRRIINQGSEAICDPLPNVLSAAGIPIASVFAVLKDPIEYQTIEEVSDIPLREDQDQRNDERL